MRIFGALAIMRAANAPAMPTASPTIPMTVWVSIIVNENNAEQMIAAMRSFLFPLVMKTMSAAVSESVSSIARNIGLPLSPEATHAFS